MVKRKKDPGYLYARKYGAKANIELHVVDDDGKPIPEAYVEVFMGMNYRKDGYWINGLTNTNGIFTIKGKTTGNEIEYYIKKDGYYKTVKLFTFAEMGKEHDVVDGKWQPYGEKENIKLRKIKKPSIINSSNKYVETQTLYEWIGYDMQKGDFVKPHGDGEISDFEIMFEWDGNIGDKFTSVYVKLRFKEEFSGYYVVEKNITSDFKWEYKAVPNKINLTEAEFSRCEKDNGQRVVNKFDSTKCFIIRSRCVTNEKGELISYNYSVISQFKFFLKKDKKIELGINGYFNPTPNDTNLEPEKVPTHSF